MICECLVYSNQFFITNAYQLDGFWIAGLEALCPPSYERMGESPGGSAQRPPAKNGCFYFVLRFLFFFVFLFNRGSRFVSQIICPTKAQKSTNSQKIASITRLSTIFGANESRRRDYFEEIFRRAKRE